MRKKIIVQYATPSDTVTFDQHYKEVHVPLVLKMPKLAKFTFSHGEVECSGTDSVYLVAELSFADADDMNYSMNSPQGQAALADLDELTDQAVTTLVISSVTPESL